MQLIYLSGVLLKPIIIPGFITLIKVNIMPIQRINNFEICNDFPIFWMRWGHSLRVAPAAMVSPLAIDRYNLK